jgi:hypothetical protein
MATCRFILLCQSAALRSWGLTDITGAGISRITTNKLPASADVTIVAQLEFSPEEAESLNRVEVRLEGPSGGVVSRLPGHMFPSFDGSTFGMNVVPYSFTVTEEGRHYFVLWVDDADLARVALDVIVS